jgi:hypothetical protein
MENTQQPATDQVEEIRLDIADEQGKIYSAIVMPISLSENCVVGSVQWLENGSLLHFLRLNCNNETNWGQRLRLVWTATRPGRASKLAFLNPKNWSMAKLTLPDLMEKPGDTVQIIVYKTEWLAALEIDSHPELLSVQEIPLNLRHLDVAEILIEMTSRMLLGHTWRTQEFTV